MRILLVTTHSLATNPRLVKEIALFSNIGCDVTVICFEFNNWSHELTKKIEREFPTVFFHTIPANRKPFLPWLFTSMVQQWSKFFLLFSEKDPAVISYACFKNSYKIKLKLAALTGKFDWIVAHNPGSFWVSSQYAHKHGIKLGIDMEDYHPGEINDAVLAKRLKVYLQKTIRGADYITAASPLILEYTLLDLKNYSGRKAVVLNGFPATEFSQPIASDSDKIKLVWFSQHISFNRGLEPFLTALEKYPDIFELHLYGQMNEAFYEQYLTTISNIIFHQPMPQKVLHHQLAQYDIGLALEDGSANLNRELCLTNKIVAYDQAGLFIIASDTLAQTAFINQGNGIITQLTSTAIEQSLEYVKNVITDIRTKKLDRFEKGKMLSWEKESKKILSLIE